MYKALRQFVIILMALPAVNAMAMYNGKPDWKDPKKVTCLGVPQYPKGMEVEPTEVYGGSFDHYIFSKMEGAMGIYYFQIFHESPPTKPLKGTATYIDSGDWSVTHHKVTCHLSF